MFLHVTSAFEEGRASDLRTVVWNPVLHRAVTVTRTGTDEHDGSLECGSGRTAEVHGGRLGGMRRTAAAVRTPAAEPRTKCLDA